MFLNKEGTEAKLRKEARRSLRAFLRHVRLGELSFKAFGDIRVGLRLIVDIMSLTLTYTVILLQFLKLTGDKLLGAPH
ncbi:hypothetical protein EVAR_12627_1 [Eumeta japonica]|uniref:Gustatory receptor n=1 Tax=Eumeta variegata TaxID=151549 RepID=A0A4C1UFN9_EUMVA|nr:hypothetical protein EVAR_12627_1 [Eumeta japonica]